MVKVIDNWYLDSDSKCIILQEERISDESKNVYYTNQTYHASVSSALEWLLKEYQRNEVQKTNSIQELLNRFEHINKRFKSEVLNQVYEVEQL